MDETARQPDTQATPFPSAATGEATRGHRPAQLIVFLVVFIDLLGFGIVLPLLPLYADEILEPLFPGADRATFRGVLLGLLMASFSFMQFLFAPLWGRLSDRVGRRPLLLLGLIGSVAFYALFGIASEIGARGRDRANLDLLRWALVLLFVARLGAGIAGATISTAQAVIADSTAPERRARGMALIGAAFGIGFTFGPLLGFGSLFLPVEGAPGFMASALSLGALVLAILLLPETLRAGNPSVRRSWFSPAGWKTALSTPTVGLLILTFFLATLAFGSLESTLALVNKWLLTGESTVRVKLTREAARTTERENFLVFAYVGFVLMMTQGLVYRRLVQRVGEVRFMRLGTALMGLGLAGAVGILLWQFGQPTALSEPTAHTASPSLLVLALLVMSVAVIGFALLTPSVQALISRRSDPAKQGEILGVNQSASAMARILGPMVGLSLFYLMPSHILPYAAGACLLVVVFLLTLRLRHE
jgi:MFS family permease